MHKRSWKNWQRETEWKDTGVNELRSMMAFDLSRQQLRTVQSAHRQRTCLSNVLVRWSSDADSVSLVLYRYRHNHHTDRHMVKHVLCCLGVLPLTTRTGVRSSCMLGRRAVLNLSKDIVVTARIFCLLKSSGCYVIHSFIHSLKFIKITNKALLSRLVW